MTHPRKHHKSTKTHENLKHRTWMHSFGHWEQSGNKRKRSSGNLRLSSENSLYKTYRDLVWREIHKHSKRSSQSRRALPRGVWKTILKSRSRFTASVKRSGKQYQVKHNIYHLITWEAMTHPRKHHRYTKTHENLKRRTWMHSLWTKDGKLEGTLGPG